jgi:integrase
VRRISLPGTLPERVVAALLLACLLLCVSGEAKAASGSYIDFGAKTLRVSRQLQRVHDGGGLLFGQPKNASRRTVDLPQRAVEALRSYRKRQRRNS